MIICYYPPTFESLHKHETKKQVLKRFDYIGMILYSGSSASLLLGLSWGGQRFRKAFFPLPRHKHAEDTDQVNASLAFGSGHCDFGRRWLGIHRAPGLGYVAPAGLNIPPKTDRRPEHLCKLEHPFFSLSTLTNRNWAMMTICSCVGSMIFYALNILWVEQLVILFQLSPSRAGWAAVSTFLNPSPEGY